MGRRSNFVRIPKDKYDTVDPRAVPPLLKRLVGGKFVEPCAGKGMLMDMLMRHGQNRLPPSETRGLDRSKTYQGWADAMADQWGNYIFERMMT